MNIYNTIFAFLEEEKPKTQSSMSYVFFFQFQTLKMPMPEDEDKDISMEEIQKSLPDFLAMTFQIVMAFALTFETSQPLGNIAPLKVRHPRFCTCLSAFQA